MAHKSHLFYFPYREITLYGQDGYIVKSETMPGEVVDKIKAVLEKPAAAPTTQTDQPAKEKPAEEPEKPAS